VNRSQRICKEIMQYLISQGYTNQVSRSVIMKAIVYIRGPDPRTIENWMRALTVNGFIEADRHKRVFRLHLEADVDLLVKAVTVDEHQKKLL
jgi:hypothetical protein